MTQTFKQHPIVVTATPAWWSPGTRCLVDGAEILAAPSVGWVVTDAPTTPPAS